MRCVPPETRETLNLLHRSLRPITPRLELKARLLEKVHSEKVVPIAALQPKASQGWQRITGMIAAGIIAVVLVGAFYQFRNRAVINTAVVNLLRDPSTRDLPLYGAGANAASQGRFLWNDSGEGHIFVANLPSAPRGKIYAVWTIARNSAPRYVGALNTDANGQGGCISNQLRSARTIETFAVTLENARHDHRPCRTDCAGIKTILRTQGRPPVTPTRAQHAAPLHFLCSLRSLWPFSCLFQNHFPVWNAGFVENRTDAAKSQLLIELDHRHLRVQIDCSRAQLLCRRNRPPEQLFPHAFTTITFEHRHAADFGATVMRHDSRGPNGFSLGSCQKMNRAVIVAIELDCSGHALVRAQIHACGSRRLVPLLRPKKSVLSE